MLYNDNYEEFLQNQRKPKKVLMDFDDCITFSSWKQWKMLYEDKEFYTRFYNKKYNNNEEFYQSVMDRENYYFEDFLIDKNSPNKIENNEIIFEKVKAIYKDQNFYADLKESNLFKEIKRNISNGNIAELTILSRINSSEEEDNKIDWLFNNLMNFDSTSKIKFFSVHNGIEKKSDIINKEKIEFDAYIEDSIPNIIDVTKNILLDISFGNEIIIPLYGYNAIDISQPEFINMIDLYNLNVHVIQNLWDKKDYL